MSYCLLKNRNINSSKLNTVFLTAPYCIAKALFNAVKGDLDNAVVFAGSNVYRVDKIISVKELLDGIVTEAEAELSKL